MYKVIQAKSLNECFRKLLRQAKKGKDAVMQVRAAIAEAATNGEITSLRRTNHGESRLDKAEKYDLGGGYRLVVQLVDGHDKIRAFLFAGTHDDTEEWLENHKDYKWVKSSKDYTLEFIQISEKQSEHSKFISPDLDSAESLRELPLLRHLSSKDWDSLPINKELREYVCKITSCDWECDPNSILEHIEEIADIKEAMFFDDLFTHSHKTELKELFKRIQLRSGQACISEGKELAKCMQNSKNSEIFVTWEEIQSLPNESSWADWLLFLHPEQKILVDRDFKGPARLRGVSGSGKTCVMLHRARYLAKKYKQPILLVTLTESMRKLLDSLIKELCGVESSYIKTYTINSLAQSVIKELHPKKESAYRPLNKGDVESLNNKVLNFVKNHSDFAKTRLASLDSIELKRFVEDEIFFIRSRLVFSDFDKYLNVKTFRRHGRRIAMNTEGRRVFLDAAKYKVRELKQMFCIDYEGSVAAANSLLSNDLTTLESFGGANVDEHELLEISKNYKPYRSVLVDEVQDLSQLEVTMIGQLTACESMSIAQVDNGLFLVGDGAQTIYNKGFVLKSCGLNVLGRSYVLKKNYRNSKEIMTASYALIEKYEFADVDEDNITKPTKPDFPSKVSEKPFIIKCKDVEAEISFVTYKVKELIEDFQSLENTDEYPEICIIGLNVQTRQKIQQSLRNGNINSSELKQSHNIDQLKAVSISTIESAKGHEFRHVFILGVVEGVMPHKYSHEDELARDASRLYVAMTRAQENLFILYNAYRNRQPSRFLLDIQPHCNEYDWKNNRLTLLS